jgi:hypothetical protein
MPNIGDDTIGDRADIDPGILGETQRSALAD